jgi:hypothetical protein
MRNIILLALISMLHTPAIARSKVDPDLLPDGTYISIRLTEGYKMFIHLERTLGGWPSMDVMRTKMIHGNYNKWPLIRTNERIQHRQVWIERTNAGTVILLSWSDAVGPFPESFARNEFDCSTGMHRTLGEGFTIAEAMQLIPGRATTLIRGTIQDQLMSHACSAQAR